MIWTLSEILDIFTSLCMHFWCVKVWHSNVWKQCQIEKLASWISAFKVVKRFDKYLTFWEHKNFWAQKTKIRFFGSPSMQPSRILCDRNRCMGARFLYLTSIWMDIIYCFQAFIYSSVYFIRSTLRWKAPDIEQCIFVAINVFVFRLVVLSNLAIVILRFIALYSPFWFYNRVTLFRAKVAFFTLLSFSSVETVAVIIQGWPWALVHKNKRWCHFDKNLTKHLQPKIDSHHSSRLQCNKLNNGQF